MYIAPSVTPFQVIGQWFSIKWMDFTNFQNVFSFHSIKILLSEFIITTKTLTKSSILIKYESKNDIPLHCVFAHFLFTPSVRCRSRQGKCEWKARISSRIHSQKGSLKFSFMENQINNSNFCRRMILHRFLHKLGWTSWTHSKWMTLSGNNTIDFGEENILTWNRAQDHVRKRWFVKSSVLNPNNFLNATPSN